ncbi:ATP-binding protein [Megasphaera hexanoica]|uniref:ATP-binding protein n=1 Tax=Megasphaera hexanoica TaxID=1675036 RepID=A0A848BR51_9FIRM|nr:ATP-binding protein [Megasphaera hexanoica]NME27328.1 winged helix-turn-helix transcriptional regulator [Megasphaera hexanoica]
MEKDLSLHGESKNVEYKERVPEDSQKYMKSVVAFANGDGGRIVFGVEDGTMRVVGIPQADLFQMMDAITNAVTDSCEPMIIPDLFVREIEGKSLIILEIAPGMQRPYYLKKKGPVKGTYIRTAGTTRLADRAILQELLLEGENKFFDQQPIPNLKVTKYDVTALCHSMSETAKKNALSDIQRQGIKELTINQLISWGILIENKDQLIPTYAYAMLTHQAGYPPVVQCAVFKTDDRAVFVDKREIDAPIQEQVEKAYQYVLEKINMGARFQGVYRQDIYELPPDSIRELIANALVHRNYLEPESVQIALFSDRLEVTSPGSLMRGVTHEKMKEGFSKIRNRALANAFAYMNLIEKWGSGFPRIFRDCRNYGLQEPEIIDFDGDLRVNLYRITDQTSDQTKKTDQTPKTDQTGTNMPVKLNEKERVILSYLQKKPDGTQHEIAEATSLSLSTIKYYMKKLQEKGCLQRMGTHRKGYWVVRFN